MLPVGYPLAGAKATVIGKKPLEEVPIAIGP